VTRALVRTTLSAYCPSVEPRAWTFETGPFGRPEILAPPSSPRLRFNVSHTDGLIACAVAVERDIGVDVEETRRTIDVEIADRYFSPSEIHELRSLPAEARPSRFFDYWTLKEWYIKARGLGLQLPLDQFAFRIGTAPPTVGIAFGPEIEDDPASWQFELRRLTPRHRLAVAIRRRPPEPDLPLRLLPTVPLGTPPSD
jgi:4'-phosphopantetheinyl transferase